ncbi:MAG: GAF domain-containing protein [Anaerolineae bacterium]
MLRAAAEISQELATLSDLDILFKRVVTLVKERFGYYHVQVFRREPALGAVVLVWGYGEPGQQMLAAGHSLRLRRGVVGTAAASGESVLATDISTEAGWIPNPYLPNTKGELAVPIRLGDRVLGIIDVQSDVAGALGEEDRMLLEFISEPIASAIESAALRQEREDHLSALRAMEQEPTAQEWTAGRQTGELPRGYFYDRMVVRPIGEQWASELGRALHEASASRETTDRGSSPVMSPLIAQGESLGVLGVYADPGHPLSDQELQLVQMVSGQVAAALGNARLADTTRAALSEARTLYRFAELLSKETDESSICASVSLALVEDLSYATSAVWILDVESDVLIEIARTGEPGSRTRHAVPLSRSGNVAVRAIQSRGTAIANGKWPDRRMTEAGLEPATPDGVGWVAAVPILAESEPLGAIEVSRPSEAPELGDRDVRILEAVAIQAANAIQRARLLRQTQDALAAADAATRRYLRDAWDSFLEGRAAETETYVAGPEGVRRDERLWLPEMQSALDRQEAVSVVAPAERGRSSRSGLAVPLKVRGEVIGVVDLYREGSGQEWDEREREMVAALVEEIGETLDGERQFAQTRATLAETERMYQASQKISAAEKRSEILGTVRDIVASTGVDQIAVFMFRLPITDGVPEEQELSTFWDKGKGEAVIPVGSRSSIEDLPVPYSMSPHKVLVVPDVRDSPQLDPALRAPLLASGFCAFAAVPLAVGDEWLGYFLGLFKSRHVFTPGELRVYEAVARQAAIALRSARLYQEAQSRARREQLIREITSRMRGTVDLETILNTAVEELGKALGVSRAFVRLSTGPGAPGHTGDATARATVVDDSSMIEGQS